MIWSHVRSKDNPADCVSRGIPPDQLQKFSLWWEGNDHIKGNFQFVKDDKNFHTGSLSTLNCVVSNQVVIKQKIVKNWDLIEKYSDFRKLLRITSYNIRFMCNILLNSKTNVVNKLKIFNFNWFNVEDMQYQNFVSFSELTRSKLLWVYLTQRAHFSKEINFLENNVNIKKSRLARLDPFLDNGLLRLGGRLHFSLLNYDQKHPLILPYKCALSDLLVDYFHRKTFHGGIRLTLSTIRQEFWIIKGRSLVKSRIHKCVECIRYRGMRSVQQMGILPLPRVQKIDKPFRATGVDYAGPYKILRYRGRGAKTYKAYLCVFICMSTKAIHLELVTGYSSDDFLAAFRRFTSTRGPCSELYSDQGTTFVGADKALKELYMASSDYMQGLLGKLAEEGTKWSFNSPGSPHFGGLWESAVKSIKHHLRRVIGNTTLTFEEFYTLLKQVEACLNSRPLVPLSDDPSDQNFLCPSFLLTQSNSYIVPEPNYLNTKIPPNQRYKMIQLLLQNWWKAWSCEYLQTLQERSKWTEKSKNINVGDIVLITDETLPPSKWPIGRILQTFPGPDDLTRVVEVKTCTSTLIRPIHKLILINSLNNESD